MLTFRYDAERPAIILSFTGKLDSVAVSGITEMMESEPLLKDHETGQRVVFDLHEVDYISSAFIRVCIISAHKAGQGNFSIINCHPFVKKTFKISGLDELLQIL